MQSEQLPRLSWYISDKVGQTDGWFVAPRAGDAGFDLRAAEDMLLSSGVTVQVATGIHLAIPAGWVGLVKDRSSMAAAGVVTSGGVIDSSYRGEVRVLLRNTAPLPYSIVKGDRIAQIVIIPCLTEGGQVGDLKSLGTTVRSDRGFGSTGRR